MNRALGVAAAAWGILGAAGLLASAAVRLQPVALAAFTARPLGAGAWTGAVASAALIGYFVGHRGLARGFAPRVVARALHLAATRGRRTPRSRRSTASASCTRRDGA